MLTWNYRRKRLDWLDLPGTTGHYASTPDAAALDITGDIIVWGRFAADDWTPGSFMVLAAKRSNAAGQISYELGLNTSGTLRLLWTANGSTNIIKTSTVATGVADGAWKYALAWLDADNGASGNDVRFYLSDDGATWTQLGTTVTTAGVTSIFAGTAEFQVGAEDGQFRFAGLVGEVHVLNGGSIVGGAIVGGTEVASPNFNLASRSRTFTDAQGNPWTIHGSNSLA